MNRQYAKPVLSIIVPVLNEAGTVRDLIRNLSRQEDADFEVILCDGGSTDGTGDVFKAAAREASFATRVIHVGRGRGRQMNGGAAAARGEFYLFLHVDSIFDDPKALRKALDALTSAMVCAAGKPVAGRFALRFRHRGDLPSLFYFYHECKSRLDRHECTHGDQGFMLHRSFFPLVGPFDESMPLLEDTRFAEAVRGLGSWVLFPAEICTSARRFETEGRAVRETLNAVVMTLAATGRVDFLGEMPRVYAGQDRASRLMLYPFFGKIKELLDLLPYRERWSFWQASGSYVAANAWQVAFFLDVRRHFRRGLPAGEGENIYLAGFERHFARVAASPAARAFAAIAVWCWFRFMLARSRLLEKPGNGGLID